jgi:hypothetical protein
LTFIPCHKTSLLQAIKANPDFSCRLLYHPQNPVLYVCMWALGPSLDLLRRSGTMLSTKKKPEALSGSNSSRNSRYWLCTSHNVLWFYQYYGDTSPRFGVEIHEAQGLMVKEKKRSTTLGSLILSDGRTWLLDFATKADALRFEVAINENRRVHKEGSSMYIQAAEATRHVPDLGFTAAYF